MFSREKVPFFQIIQERTYSSAIFFGKTIFSGHLKIMPYFHVFVLKSSFIFRLTNKMILSGKRSITFRDNTRNIIFQRDFFEKAIFSEHLENENMVFRAVNNTLVFNAIGKF